MNKYLRNLILFLLPLIMVFMSCFVVLYKAGELCDFDKLQPLEEGQLLGPAYTDINEPFKFMMTDRYMHCDVIALGSSRIMQVRRDVINKSLSYYNAGGAVNNIYQYDYFLSLTNITPKLFILSVDQWYFNNSNAGQKGALKKDCYKYKQEKNIIQKCISLLQDLVKGKVNLGIVFDPNNKNIGLNAKINKNGFMHDGSYYYGDFIKNPSSQKDYKFEDTFSRIDNGSEQFAYGGKGLNRIAFEEFDKFLQNCSERGIYVIAIMPPFAPSVLHRMEKSGHYEYMKKIYAMLQPCFSKYANCWIYDYTDMSKFGVTDAEFVDGFHGSELTYNRIILNVIAHNNEVRRFFVDSHKILDINSKYVKKGIKYHPS